MSSKKSKASNQSRGAVDTKCSGVVLFWHGLYIQLLPTSLVFSQTGLFNCEL